MLPFSLTNWKSWLSSKMNDPFCWDVFAWSLHQGGWAWPGLAGLPEQGCWAPRPGGQLAPYNRYRDNPFRAEVWPSLELIPDLWRGHACRKSGEQQSLTLALPNPSISASPSFKKHQCGLLEPSFGLVYSCPHSLHLRPTLACTTPLPCGCSACPH